MRMRVVILVFLIFLAPSSSAGADNITLEISEAMLNKLVDIYRLNELSENGNTPPVCYGELPTLFEHCQVVGFFNCLPFTSEGLPEPAGIPMAVCETVGGGRYILPGQNPVQWKYWVSHWKFEILNGDMQFHATITTEVESEQKVIERNVSAQVIFDTNSKQLRVVIAPFKVTLKSKSCSIVSIDIDKKFSFAIPIHLQQLSFPAPDGGTRNINTNIKHFTPRYLQDKLKLIFDLEFN